MTADPTEDHSQENIFSIHGPFFPLYGLIVKEKTSISHLIMLICAPDNISEVLINHVFSDDDLLCFGFIQSSFFSVSAGV